VLTEIERIGQLAVIRERTQLLDSARRPTHSLRTRLTQWIRGLTRPPTEPPPFDEDIAMTFSESVATATAGPESSDSLDAATGEILSSTEAAMLAAVHDRDGVDAPVATPDEVTGALL
jgi:hypothetical protein